MYSDELEVGDTKPGCCGRLRYWVTKSEAGALVAIFVGVFALGTALGFALPPDGTYPEPWRHVSSIIGWIYFSAWSVSFWPQIVINARRKSVQGLSFDFACLNLLGFACYTAYNTALYWNEDIRAAYAAAHGGSLPAVQSNDVFFALHALLCTALVCGQIVFYDRAGQRVSYLATAAIAGCVIAAAIYAALAATHTAGRDWLDYLTFLSYVKLGISLSKYIPQVLLNIRKRSTEGWSIENVLLDITGGGLSIAQLLMDCAVSDDWSGIQGDPVKFGLGFVSIVFDLIFIAQHFCIYRRARYAHLGAGYPVDDGDAAAGGSALGAYDDGADGGYGYSYSYTGSSSGGLGGKGKNQSYSKRSPAERASLYGGV